MKTEDNSFITRRRIIIAAGLLLVLVPIGLYIYSGIFSASLTLSIAPSVSTIMVNGKTYKNGAHKMRPGEYEIVVSMDGFDEYRETITLTKDEKKEVLVALRSNSASTANWYQEHSDDASIADGIASHEFIKNSEAYAEKYPIVKKLPYNTPRYRIGYGICSDSKDDFCIVINAETGYRTEAFDYLGTICDPAEYRIEYLEYTNPFKEYIIDAN